MRGSKVVADIKRNRLSITLASTVSKKELEKIYTDVRFCVADLTSGFDVITDLSQCRIGHLNSLSTLRKIMDYLVVHQPGEIIRIVGRSSLVFKQLLRFATRIQGYKPIYVTSVEEAEEKLRQAIKRNGLRFQMHRQRVRYTAGQEEGQGDLVDISVSGCAVREITLPVSGDMELSITIPFAGEHETPAAFSLTAKVVRVDDELFAVQFLDLDNDQKAHLYKCLAQEARREMLSM